MGRGVVTARGDSRKRPWRGGRVLLGVTGGVAAYKSIQVARDLTLLGAELDVVMTNAAQRFATPLSFEAVTGRPVLTELFSAEGAARHIGLGRDADVVCVAPATADFLNQMAEGRASDLLTTSLLATRAPVLLCPAMNPRMLGHPRVAESLALLKERDGVEIAGPDTGPLAAGEGEGRGRMAEPREIVNRVGRALGSLTPGPLASKRVLVTAGPTREPIDPVRYVGNRSSGRMGYAIAKTAWLRGAEVALISGPSELSAPTGVDRRWVETASEMREGVLEISPECDLLVFCAAVADLRPRESFDEKLKRSEAGGGLSLTLVPGPDVAGAASTLRKEGSVSVGFALETCNLVGNAAAKLADGRFDIVVANPANEPGAGFESETNRVIFLRPNVEPERLPPMVKESVAVELLDRVESLFESRGSST